MRMKLILFFTFLISFSCYSTAYGEIRDRTTENNSTMNYNIETIEPQQIFNESDGTENIHIYEYDPLITYKIRCRLGMKSIIILPENEIATAHSLGDIKNFIVELTQYSPSFYAYSVEGLKAGKDSSLIIFGKSGNTYTFYIREDSVNSPYHPILVTYIVDNSLNKNKNIKFNNLNQKDVFSREDKTIFREIDALNLNNLYTSYTAIGGDISIAPLRIFDDSYSTYFVFSDTEYIDKKNIPEIYEVVNGYDNTVPIRIYKGTVKIKKVSQRWTLKHGEKHLCIKREETNTKLKSNIDDNDKEDYFY